MALLRYGHGRCGRQSTARRGPFSLGTELLTFKMPRAVTTYKKQCGRIIVVGYICRLTFIFINLFLDAASQTLLWTYQQHFTIYRAAYYNAYTLPARADSQGCQHPRRVERQHPQGPLKRSQRLPRCPSPCFQLQAQGAAPASCDQTSRARQGQPS